MHQNSRGRPLFALDRAIDLVGAATIGIAVAPLVGLAALAILVTSGRPAWYVALRLGRDARPFACYKLRTMTVARAGGAPRITGVGRLLRAACVDELPQLWNVLRGEMRLDGPRPLSRSAFAREPEVRRARCAVEPGLTGLAQIRTRAFAPTPAVRRRSTSRSWAARPQCSRGESFARSGRRVSPDSTGDVRARLEENVTKANEMGARSDWSQRFLSPPFIRAQMC